LNVPIRIDVKQELYSSKSDRLVGKRILVLGTGSVAIFKTPDVVRELIRHGAEVDVMLSPDAAKLVSPAIFEWASGRRVRLDITGNVEHVLFAGEHPQKVDLVIVCPLTASTLGKFVHGIADTNVSLTLMTALGSKIPILLVPGMHEPMFNNPFVQNNISLVKDLPSVTFLQPRVEEHKAKIPSLDTVIAWSIKLLSPKFLEGKSVLVTGGPTYEFIDRVRFIGNPSSGKMGYSVALEAWYLGANVTFIVGPNNLDLTSLFNIIQVDSASEMADHVITTLKTADFSIAIFSAAVADFTPVSFTDDKIRSSTQDLTITLKSTPKILKLVKELKNSSENNKLLVVGFKAEFNKSKQELQEITSSYITNGLADIMVANIIGSSTTGFQVDTTEVHIFSRQDYHFVAGPKSTVAQSLFAYLKDKK
jgi:phosphopantothenoylcysteine decarboxylase/phosphopantothenate--cysteine ligase